MIVKCVKEYNDLQLKKLVKVGEIFEVDDNRAKVLFAANVAEETTPTEVDKKPVAKKSTTKKKEA